LRIVPVLIIQAVRDVHEGKSAVNSSIAPVYDSNKRGLVVMYQSLVMVVLAWLGFPNIFFRFFIKGLFTAR